MGGNHRGHVSRAHWSTGGGAWYISGVCAWYHLFNSMYSGRWFYSLSLFFFVPCLDLLHDASLVSMVHDHALSSPPKNSQSSFYGRTMSVSYLSLLSCRLEFARSCAKDLHQSRWCPCWLDTLTGLIIGHDRQALLIFIESFVY
jgi:hypothetical protein